MKPRPVSEVIDQDRRQLLSTAAMGIAAIAVAGTMLATSAFAQSAREVRGPTPYFAVENEPAPKLIVDPALPGPLALGLVQIQYRVENVRIVPVFGAAALNISPRVGHLHITVDPASIATVFVAAVIVMSALRLRFVHEENGWTSCRIGKCLKDIAPHMSAFDPKRTSGRPLSSLV